MTTSEASTSTASITKASTSKGRTFNLVLRRAEAEGLLPQGDSLLAATRARMSGFTAESGEFRYFERPPAVMVGVSDSALLVFGRKGFRTSALLRLLTHAQRDFDRIELQWVTPNDTGSCLSLHGISPGDTDDFWSCLKHQRDTAWLGHSREQQVELSWLSRTRPGALWRNDDGSTRDGFAETMTAFVSGDPARQSPTACSYVNVPVRAPAPMQR